MKTKNVRVRVKDIKQGVTIYIAHPAYGIEEAVVVTRPYVSHFTGYLLFDVYTKYGYNSESVGDAGITSGDSYNYRRTFFKRKHAEEWVNKMATDKGFLKNQAQNKAWNDMFDDLIEDEWEI